MAEHWLHQPVVLGPATEGLFTFLYIFTSKHLNLFIQTCEAKALYSANLILDG